MIEQLDVFLGEATRPFVEKLFNAITSEEYLLNDALDIAGLVSKSTAIDSDSTNTAVATDSDSNVIKTDSNTDDTTAMGGNSNVKVDGSSSASNVVNSHGSSSNNHHHHHAATDKIQTTPNDEVIIYKDLQLYKNNFIARNLYFSQSIN